MSIVKPFCALRPAPAFAAKVASLPYDVMDSEEARVMAADDPYSFLHVTKSEIDLPTEISQYDPQVYAKARENLEHFMKDNILIQDPKPCFYIYKQRMGNHEQIGLAAIVSVDEYEQGLIKKHELTRPDKELDRVNHVDITGAQTGSVFLTYRAEARIDALIEKAMEQPPVYDFTASDGISHTLYVVSDQTLIGALEGEFAKLPALYVADGHHRSAAACRVREMRKQQNPKHTGQEDYNYFLAVIFPHNRMQIMDYNRVVCDLNGLTEEQLLDKLSEKFTLERSDTAYKPTEAHTFGMYLQKQWYKLTAKPETFPPDNVISKLDVSILQNNVLSPLLGIGDPRTDKRIHFVGGIRGMEELERLVNQGKYAIAFSLYPTSIDELMDIADAGQIMPPKSTWFEPKLRDAMTIHKM